MRSLINMFSINYISTCNSINAVAVCVDTAVCQSPPANAAEGKLENVTLRVVT